MITDFTGHRRIEQMAILYSKILGLDDQKYNIQIFTDKQYKKYSDPYEEGKILLGFTSGRAYYHAIVLFLDNIKSKNTLLQTLFHELLHVKLDMLDIKDAGHHNIINSILHADVIMKSNG